MLVAIAVPLFVGQLTEAEESVKNANIRAVRGAAVEQILTDSKYLTDKTGAKYTTWYAQAKVSANGEISGLQIACGDTDGADFKTKLSDKDGLAEKADGVYTVTVKITDLTASKKEATSPDP